MNKRLLLLFLILALTLPFSLRAEITEGVINARILPTIWFSSIKPVESSKVKVYTAVQNNSGINFTGDVIFFLDGVEFDRVLVNSASDSLTEVNTNWIATPGKHIFSTKIEVELGHDQKLLSYESNEEVVSVPDPVTFEEVKEKTTLVLSALGEKIDEGADLLSTKLESYKRIAPDDNGDEVLKNDQIGDDLSRVAGTSTSPEKVNDYSFVDSLINKGIDLSTYLLGEWEWALVGATVIIVFLSFVI